MGFVETKYFTHLDDFIIALFSFGVKLKIDTGGKEVHLLFR